MLYTNTLQKNYQFRYVYNKGKSNANKFLVIYITKNNSRQNRLGISVSKKVGNSVVRSRITRLIRENYRLLEKQGLIKKGFDIVFIARVSTKESTFYDIEKSIVGLLKKSGLYEVGL